jgi:hypothetical protein
MITSWLHGFLLNHVSSDRDAAPFALTSTRRVKPFRLHRLLLQRPGAAKEE